MTTITTISSSRPVPVEDAPALVTGRPSRPGARRLGPDDYRRLLETLATVGVVPFADLDASTVAVRLDMSAGLTEAALLLADVEREVGIVVRKGLSPVRAGDLCVFSEGRVRVDPRVRGFLDRLTEDSDGSLYLLNELVDLFLACGRDPRDRMGSIAEQLASMGFTVEDTATAVDDDPATELNLLLLGGEAVPARVLDQYAVDAQELRYGGAMPPSLARSLDHVRAFEVETREPAARRYSHRLRHTLRLPVRIRVARSFLRLVRSGAEGWRLSDETGARGMTTDELCAWLASSGMTGVGVVCEADHFAALRAAPARSHVRPLPYPFDHYLAVNSDVDYSTETQLERIHERVSDELGLAIGGSFYLDGARSDAITVDAPLERWFAEGSLDTFHAWMDTLDVVELRAVGTVWRPPSPIAAPEGGGVLLESSAPLESARVRVVLDDRTKQVLTPRGSYFGWDGDPKRRIDHVRIDGVDDAGLRVRFVSLDPQRERDAVTALVARGVTPPLFTTHGGGDAVREFGNLHVGRAREQRDEESAHDLDREDSPFFLLPALRELGVRFVSPIGHASTAKLTPVGHLAGSLALADGSEIGAFRRFLSRRHVELGFPERWRDGKNAASPAALGFLISDTLQRLRWAEPGHGGILYTHLGHNTGDQSIDRIGWSEETHGALETLAACHHGDSEDDVPLPRVWVTPAALILRHAEALGRSVEVDGDTVRIGEGHASSPPHGLTIYVEDPERARVEIAGRPIDALTRNGPDDTGRPSVTLVDDTAPRALLLPGNVVAQRTEGGRATLEPRLLSFVVEDAEARAEWTATPVPLRGVTHVSLAVEAEGVDDLEIALADTRGTWYPWPLPVDAPMRRVLSLADRRPCADGHPRHAILGVRIVARRRGAEPGRVLVRDLSLLRPRLSAKAIGTTCALGGRVDGEVPGAIARGRVVVAMPDGARTYDVDTRGRYAARDLPRGALVRCRLEIDDRHFLSVRGREALMTCDQWDWDFKVRAADLLAGR